MNFDGLLSQYKSKACILSVEKHPDGTYGNICVVVGNRAHSIDLESRNKPYVPGAPYDMSFPKNRNFEEQCYRCLHEGKSVHAYINMYVMGLWLNMFLIPLETDDEDVGYCAYFYEVAPKADSSAMADLSVDVASDVLKACIKLRSSKDTKNAFQDVVEDIRVICDSEHSCILLTDPDTRSCTIFGDALKPGTKLLPMEHYLEGFYEITETWPDTLAGSTCVILKDKRDMERLRAQNPIWAASLAEAGVENIVLFPLLFNGCIFGYIWSLNFNVSEINRIKEILELTTFFLASEIANYRLLQQLEYMSMMDSLTGTMNRNMMNHRIDQIVAGNQPMPKAVLFVDLNGLKRLNDERGHVAGDNTLHSVAVILQEVFPDGEVYRAGGDEFMVLVPEIAKDDLLERVDLVHARSENLDVVSFSIGVRYGDTDILRAMHLADEQMYANKRAYYEVHSDLKYR